jgi:hypothetical protein
MTKIDRRDFLLHVAPLVAAPALILGSVSEMEAQIKNFALRTPTNNSQVSVGQTVQISLALIRTAYPKISRIDFKANNQIIGTSSTRPYQLNWQPTQAGNFALTAEAVLSNGTIVTTPTVNVASAHHNWKFSMTHSATQRTVGVGLVRVIILQQFQMQLG